MDSGISWPNKTVVLENEKSDACDIWGPSRSRPGPILFLIYTNDLPDRTRSKVRLFADNTVIYLAVSNLQNAQILQQHLDRLHEWELQWDVELTQSKCVVIHDMSHEQKLQTLVSTCCMVRFSNRLGAPSIWAWKSVTTCLLIITSRKYAHQQVIKSNIRT